jgi:hypothetical protein
MIYRLIAFIVSVVSDARILRQETARKHGWMSE